MKKLLSTLVILTMTIPLLSQDTTLLNTSKLELRDCLPFLGISNTKVITSVDELKNAVPEYNRKGDCRKQLKKFDFDSYTIIGINLNSGWCRVPKGLDFKTYKIENAKQYLLVVSYIKPIEPCRALSSYDLWVKVPKVPEGFEVKFQINEEGESE